MDRNKMTNVVIVDDEPILLLDMVEMVQYMGFNVAGFPVAEKVIQYAASGGEIDVLITDINMPGIRGNILARELRKHKPNLPVIFISGAFKQEIDVIDGVCLFMMKPYSMEQIERTVRQALSMVD